MPGTVSPYPKLQFFTNAGAPANAYQLFTYAAGTSTKQATYSDANLTIANTNPIVLDAYGRATVFLSATSYKFVLATNTDTDPPTSPVWSVDNVSAVSPVNASQDIDGIAGENLTFGQCAICSDGFGGRTVGQWYRSNATNVELSTNIVVAGFPLSDILAGATGSFRIVGKVTGLAGLTVGVNYFMSAAVAGAITTTAPGNKRCVGFSDSTSSLIVTPWAGLYVP